MIDLASTHPNLSENGVRIVNELSDRADAALATPPPEPVAYIHRQGNHWEVSERVLLDDEKKRGWTEEPLYADTPPPEPTTSQIIFNDSSTEEVIRLDKEGFHYKGQFIADAGEAHRLMLAFLKQHAKAEPEPPTEEELSDLWTIYDGIVDLRDFVIVARAVIDRWGK